MNSGVGRILIGLAFVVLGAMRISKAQRQGIYIFGVLILLYGLFSVGQGIYKMVKKPKLPAESDDTLDNEIE